MMGFIITIIVIIYAILEPKIIEHKYKKYKKEKENRWK